MRQESEISYVFSVSYNETTGPRERGWGSGGRRFKSSHPDQKSSLPQGVIKRPLSKESGLFDVHIPIMYQA
jgi:hypothetical protein